MLVGVMSSTLHCSTHGLLASSVVLERKMNVKAKDGTTSSMWVNHVRKSVKCMVIGLNVGREKKYRSVKTLL